MKVTGTCKISNDPATNNLKLEFDKTPSGLDVVNGTLYWYNSSKKEDKSSSSTKKEDKSSSSTKKEDKSSSNIRFVGYKNMVNFFRDNCHELINITNSLLKSYRGTRKDGTKYYGHEIIIFDAQVFNKNEAVQSFHEPKVESGEDIPW